MTRSGRRRLARIASGWLDGDIAGAFFEDVVAQARATARCSRRAGQKSFTRKDRPSGPPEDPGNPTVDFHGDRRTNATHPSTTDPDSRLFKKTRRAEAKLAYLGEVLRRIGTAWSSMCASRQRPALPSETP